MKTRLKKNGKIITALPPPKKGHISEGHKEIKVFLYNCNCVVFLFFSAKSVFIGDFSHKYREIKINIWFKGLTVANT
jgi:hypothetical protein